MEIRPPTPEDLEGYAKLASFSFASPLERSQAWARHLGPELQRVAAEGLRVVGGYGVHQMGQFWGGRRVGCFGIAAVCVEPAGRGAGVGRQLMTHALEWAAKDGFPLAALYPATQPLYRAVGFEQAGVYERRRVPLEVLLGPAEARAAVSRVELDDIDPLAALETIKVLYREKAVQQPGHLDRSDAIWRRLVDPLHGPRPRAVLFRQSGRPTGYAIYTAAVTSGMEQQVELLDHVALSGRARRALLAFASGFASLGRSVVMRTGPVDGLLLLATEQRTTVVESWRFMIRIVDVAAALEARGYNTAASGQLDLHVVDDVLAQNAGAYRLTVEDGRGRVERISEASSRVTQRGLAALFAGAVDPTDLVAAGLIEAHQVSVEMMRALFRGPTPWSADFF